MRIKITITTMLLALLVITLAVSCALAAPPAPGLGTDLPVENDISNYYLGAPLGNAQNGVSYWNEFLRVNVYNSDEMLNAYGGEPVWTVSQTKGEPVQYTWKDDVMSGTTTRRVIAELTQAPTHPIAGAEFTITCTWGGQTASKVITFNAIDLPLPQDLDTAAVIDGVVGQDVQVDLSALLNGWSVPGCAPIRWRLVRIPGSAAELDMDTVNPGYATIHCNQTGVYEGRLCVRVDSLLLYKQIELRVSDQNGKPALQLGVYGGTEERVYIGMPQYYSGLGSDNEAPAYGIKPWFQFGISNYDEMENYYGGEPRWTVTQTAGTPVDVCSQFDLWNGNGYYSLEIGDVPAAPTTAEWDVTCAWGDQSDTKHLKVDFLESPNGAPKDTDYPEIVNLTVGDTLVIEPHYVPAAWTLPGEPPFVIVFDEQLEPFAERDHQKCTTTHLEYTVTETGIFNAAILLSVEGRINAGHETIFIVKDAQGNTPPVELSVNCNQGDVFRRNFYIDMNFEPGVFNFGMVQTDPQITYFYLRNTDMCARLLSGDPVWKVTPRNGAPAVKMEDNGRNGMDLAIAALPSQPMDAVYLIECDWDNVHWEQEYTVSFMTSPNGLPIGLEMDFGDALIVRTGEEFDLWGSVRFRNGWEIPGEEYYVLLGGGDNIWDGVDADTGGTPGIYDANASAMSANVRWIEPFTLIVTRADGTLPAADYPVQGNLISLPAGTKRIESQAFAGVPIGNIDIPAAVTFIAEDAFDGCGLVYAYCHNQYAVDYAVSHGLVPLTDN